MRATRHLIMWAGILALGLPHATVHAAGRYDPILEWNGPSFKVLHAPGTGQSVEDPVLELPFHLPRGVAAREHDGRDVVYVLDSGHNRIQAFEVNATYQYLSSVDMSFAAVPLAGEFSDQSIRTPEFAAVPTQWIVPFSEAIHINGTEWTRVDDLTGYSAADRVYNIDYAALTNHPQFAFPAGSLSATSLFEARYVLTDLQDYGAATPVPGIGDVDYGVHHGDLNITKITIGEGSGGPAAWDEVRGLALTADVSDPTTDLLFVIDAADQSGQKNEQIFSYFVTETGAVSPWEQYDDYLSGPYDAAVAEMGDGAGASAWISANTGPFDKTAYPFIADASLVTGHTYRVDVAAGAVTIVDETTNRTLVNGAPQAAFADPYLGLPGLSLPLNAGAWADGTIRMYTTRAYPERFLFVADTGNDRIKVVGLPSAATAPASVWDGDWLPGDTFLGVQQPGGAGALGATVGEEHYVMTPAVVGESWQVFTGAFPLEEATLLEMVMDPLGVARSWRRVNDLSVAGPVDSVYAVDWATGGIEFGDGVHGALPPSNTLFACNYTTTPDLLRYGSSGTAMGRFTSPRGIAARWNPTLGRFDLYVSDTGNGRIQKLAFVPADTTLQLPAYVEAITTWQYTSGSNDLLYAPTDLAVEADLSGNVHLAVCDTGNRRAILYRDSDARVPGSTVPPSFVKMLGTSGNRVGNYVSPQGVTLIPHGTDLDLYLTDEARAVTTKYEGGPTPTIDILTVGESALPQSFPPHSGYTITFETRYAPLGGWVDFYFDTSGTFDEATAKLCFPAGQTSPTATSAYWKFAASPAGPPPDGRYYIFARLKDLTGSTVAWDQAAPVEILTIDSSLVPTLQARDAIDGDRTLYLQNNLRRAVNLQILYPDSTVGVGFGCAYDPAFIRVLAISPGTAFDGLGATNFIFASSVDSAGGRFEVNASVTGAPTGLVKSGPHTVAILQVECRANAISTALRFKDGVLGLDKARSNITRLDGELPEAWTTRSLQLRAGYLGDIATGGAGADSTVPHLQPRPDGKIDFEDQMAFTLGWNGLAQVQDRIADLGPGSGNSPNLFSTPDAAWTVDDILAFTSQASYFGVMGWNNGTGEPGGGSPQNRHPDQHPVTDPDPESDAPVFVVTSDEGDQRIRIDVHVRDIEDLMGAHLELTFNPWVAYVEDATAGGHLSEGAEMLFLTHGGRGRSEVGISRLSHEQPGRDGSGLLASFHLRAREVSALSLEWDLRAVGNLPLGTGALDFDSEPLPAAGATPIAFHLAPVTPNPTQGPARLHFGLSSASPTRLVLYDVQGRRVRLLWDAPLDAGTHTLTWDGLTDDRRPASAGVYYYALTAGPHHAVRSLLRLP